MQVRSTEVNNLSSVPAILESLQDIWTEIDRVYQQIRHHWQYCLHQTDRQERSTAVARFR